MDEITTAPGYTLRSCPHCGIRYKVVKAVSDEPTVREIECRACGGPLQAREGRHVLKYFLIERRSRSAG